MSVAEIVHIPQEYWDLHFTFGTRDQIQKSGQSWIFLWEIVDHLPTDLIVQAPVNPKQNNLLRIFSRHRTVFWVDFKKQCHYARKVWWCKLESRIPWISQDSVQLKKSKKLRLDV